MPLMKLNALVNVLLESLVTLMRSLIVTLNFASLLNYETISMATAAVVEGGLSPIYIKINRQSESMR